MKISIIIPVYNIEKYLSECLESILNQTFKDFEVICVNDGSTDSSLEILKSFAQKDSRFKIFSQKNQGAAIARNTGIKQAKGEYLQFLDSDDYFEPNMLEELYCYAEKYDSDLVVCSSRKVDDFGNITESRNPNSPINLDLTPLNKVFNRKDIGENIFSILTPVPWNKLYKRDLILKNGIEFPNLKICEDVAFVHCAVACAEKIVVFDKELINYRFNRENSMATYRSKYTIDVVKSCLNLKHFLETKDLYTEIETAFIKAFKNHLRWEIALCNDKEYQLFLEEFKALMPDDWENFKDALRKDFIDIEYLNKFIGSKKVMLWGASFFLQNLLKKEKFKNPNILGIIDKNTASWGTFCGNYEIFSPEALHRLKPDAVLMTVWSNHEQVYEILKKEFKEKYPETELLPNIFKN